MASRRSRIKGIVNIPQRRKPTLDISTSSEDTKEEVKHDESNLETATQDCESIPIVPNVAESLEEKEKPPPEINKIDEKIAPAPPVKPTQPAFRRRILKPAISLKAINRSSTAPSVSPPNEPQTPNAQEEPVPESASISSCHVPDNTPKKEEKSKIPQSPIKQPQIIDNCISKEISVLGITNLQPLKPTTDNLASTQEQEINRPPPACSPSKLMNRARIKAIPRLGQRRTSFSIGSASESEDESKKSYKTLRVRNDSVCSSVSTPAISESPAAFPDANSPRKKTEFNTVIQRKCRRTEQSRKLAEARREFLQKFGDKTPDRQKLTMIDLIFYNPGSIEKDKEKSQKRKRQDTESSNVSQQQEVQLLEEDVDEPPALDDPPEGDRSDEENAIPAPQITIGANGEIIIDEKSLYIENKELKRDRDALSKSSVVDGDQITDYGVCKRIRRCKDWTKTDTLRFYKALNTLGTDFTLMCGLFPGRSRRELKLKFKKEERVNRALIDRAITQPVQFDITDLQKDLEQQELEELRKEQLKKDIEENKEARKSKSQEKENEIEKGNEKIKKPKRKRRAVVVRREMPKTVESSTKELLKNKLNKGINSLLDSDESDTENKRENVKKKKVNEKNNNRIVNQENSLIESEDNTQKVVEETHETIEDIATFINQEQDGGATEIIEIKDDQEEKLIQGSIILSTVVEDGQDVHKVFTVNANGEKVPVELTPEIMEILLKSQKDNNDNNPGPGPAKGVELISITQIDSTQSNTVAKKSANEVQVVSITQLDSKQSNREKESVVTPATTTVDISLSNIHDQTDLSMRTDCMILSFEDIDMPPPNLPPATGSIASLKTIAREP